MTVRAFAFSCAFFYGFFVLSFALEMLLYLLQFALQSLIVGFIWHLHLCDASDGSFSLSVSRSLSFSLSISPSTLYRLNALSGNSRRVCVHGRKPRSQCIVNIHLITYDNSRSNWNWIIHFVPTAIPATTTSNERSSIFENYTQLIMQTALTITANFRWLRSAHKSMNAIELGVLAGFTQTQRRALVSGRRPVSNLVNLAEKPKTKVWANVRSAVNENRFANMGRTVNTPLVNKIKKNHLINKLFSAHKCQHQQNHLETTCSVCAI